ADLPAGDDLHAVLGHKAQPHVGAAEHDAADLGAVILEREVHVARGVVLEVGDLALHPHVPPAGVGLQQALHIPGEFVDGEDPCVIHRAASQVLCSSMATVMGPTPPGTGVIHPATSRTASKSTSPTRRPPGRRLMPTSMTAAPGLTCWGPMSPGRPTATTSTSAWRVNDARSGVREWQMVTVASWARSSAAMGRPTMGERPTTTACRPATGMS